MYGENAPVVPSVVLLLTPKPNWYILSFLVLIKTPAPTELTTSALLNPPSKP